MTPKQLDLLLQAHRCAGCQKMFRLTSGLKFYTKDCHEDVNNNKETGSSQTLEEHTSEKDKNIKNPSVLVNKHSVKKYFNVRKLPIYIANEKQLQGNFNRDANNANYRLDLELVDVRTKIKMLEASFSRIKHFLPSDLAIKLNPDSLKASNY